VGERGGEKGGEGAGGVRKGVTERESVCEQVVYIHTHTAHTHKYARICIHIMGVYIDTFNFLVDSYGTHTYTHTHTPTYTHTYTHTHIHTHIYTHIYIHTHIHTHTHTHIYTHTHTYIYIQGEYIYIYTPSTSSSIHRRRV